MSAVLLKRSLERSRPLRSERRARPVSLSLRLRHRCVYVVVLRAQLLIGAQQPTTASIDKSDPSVLEPSSMPTQQGQCARWEAADLARFDLDRHLVLALGRMEMRRAALVEGHANNNPEEARISGMLS